MVPVETRKAQLEARLAELTHRLRRIDDELDQPVSERFAEQAVEREDEEMLEDLGAAGLREVRMIEAALDRIANGSYGVCVRCGEPIGDDRLDVVPHTPFCRDCAAGR
jgi:DnaK suppressor protein